VQLKSARKTMQINTSNDGRNGYMAFFNGKKAEVYADSSLQAQERAIAYFKPAKSKRHMVFVMIAESNGQQVTHSTTSI
jgi:hypothetical protein